MPLSAEQRARLDAEAKHRGIKSADLIAAAEAELERREKAKPPAAEGRRRAPVDNASEDSDNAPTDEPGSLFMYLLPFVTVGEVRRIWLKVPGSLPGADDNENAAGWAAKTAGSATPPSGDPPST